MIKLMSERSRQEREGAEADPEILKEFIAQPQMVIRETAKKIRWGRSAGPELF